MERKFLSLLFAFFFCCATHIVAQVRVRGQVVDGDGKAIEYVTVIAIEDSIGVVADANGVFEIKVHNENVRLTFTHVSYEVLTIAASKLLGSDKVVLKEKNVDLPDVSIVIGKKLKTITGKGMRGPGNVAITGIDKSVREVGSVTSVSKNYTVEQITIPIIGSSYDKCKLSLHFYEIDGKNFVPIQSVPIYVAIDKCGKQTLNVEPTEKIILRKGHRYFTSISLVELSGKGSVTFPAYFKSGYVRNLESGKQKKLPISLGMEIKGREVKYSTTETK